MNTSILATLRATRAFRALAAARYVDRTGQLRGLLLNAWNSELGLYLVDDADPRLQAANQWNAVYSYYATGRLALAWLLVRDGQVPQRHRLLLRALAAQVSAGWLFPLPWSLCCTALNPAVYAGFPSSPQACSNLANGVNPYDRVAMLLRTTRERNVRTRVLEATRQARRNRARPGERSRQDAAMEATTLFDFTWRSRTRANYGDPSMFYVGTLTPERSAQYIQSVRSVTTATMLLFEALVAQRARSVLTDAAVHFISRDRSDITERVLVPRLRALGLLAP